MNSRKPVDLVSSKAFILDPPALRTGDIVLSKDDQIVSWTIRWGTWSQLSHAAIHVGGGFLVEAVGKEGVRKTHVRNLIFPKINCVRVLRPRQASEEVLDRASHLARSLVYRPYSVRGAVGTVVPIVRAVDDPGRFCTQVVAECFLQAGLPIVRGMRPEQVQPKHILRSKESLEDVTNMVIHESTSESVLRAFQMLRPTMQVAHEGDGRPVAPEQVEKTVLDAVAPIMARYSGFTRPYHYFDVVRQLAQNAERAQEAVRAVDETIMSILRGRQLLMPRASIPGLVEEPMSFNIMPVLDAGERQDMETFVQLCGDLRYGEQWNRQDWEETLQEFEEASERTRLPCLRATHNWLLGDYAHVDANYRQLDMVPRKQEIDDYSIGFE